MNHHHHQHGNGMHTGTMHSHAQPSSELLRHTGKMNLQQFLQWQTQQMNDTPATGTNASATINTGDPSASPSATTSPNGGVPSTLSPTELYELMQSRLHAAMQQGQMQPSSIRPMAAPPNAPHQLHNNTGLITAPMPDERMGLLNPFAPMQNTHSHNIAPPDERSILTMNPPHNPHAPTPFAAPVLDDNALPFIASAGGQQATGSFQSLPHNILANPGVRIVVEHPLIFAVKADDAAKVEELLKIITPHCIDGEGHSALHWAARRNYVHAQYGSITDMLLKAGAQAGFHNRFGETPLHWACAAGMMGSTRSLLRVQYSLLFQYDAQGWSPWIRAAQEGHILLLDFLLQFHPPNWQMDMVQPNSSSSTSSASSSTMDLSHIPPVLTIDLPDSKRKTALHWAAYNNNKQLCEWILDNGFENMLYDRDGEDALPIHWAALRGNKAIVELFLTYHGTHTPKSNSPALSRSRAMSQEQQPLLAASTIASNHNGTLAHHNNAQQQPVLISDPVGFLLSATDCTGMDVLALARDKKKRLSEELAQERRKMHEARQRDEELALGGGAADTRSLLGNDRSASSAPTFSLRSYSWKSYLLCFYPLIFFLLHLLGVLPKLQSRTRSLYESCRKGLGMTYSPSYMAFLKKQTATEKNIKAVEKTMTYLEGQKRAHTLKQKLGLIQPKNLVTKLLAALVSYCQIPSLGWFISRWLGFIMISGGWIYWTYYWVVMSAEHPILHTFFIISWYLMFYTFLACVYGDPGIIQPKVNTGSGYKLLQTLLSLSFIPITRRNNSHETPATRFTHLRSEYTRILSQARDVDSKSVCVSCRIYRTPRSKHCRSCGVCMDRFDHHCPWINNCVAEANHRTFIIFLATANLTIILLFIATWFYSATIGVENGSQVDAAWYQSNLTWYQRWFPHLSREPAFYLWILHYIFYVLLLSSLLHQHLNLICQNLTINEAVNWFKYSSFQNHHGDFMNPYDHGTKQNCLRFFCHPTDRHRPPVPFSLTSTNELNEIHTTSEIGEDLAKQV